MILRMAATALALSSVFIGSAMADTLSLRGSTTVVANVFANHEQAIEADTGVALDVIGNGSTQGVLDVVAGTADIGMISAPLASTAAKAAERQADFNGDALQAHQIGETRVAFLRHKDNPVTVLTMDQIGDILGGRIKNWSEVGGDDAPIVVIVEKVGGLRSMATKSILGGEEISAVTRPMPIATQVPKVVAQLKNALGIAASAVVSDATPEIVTDETIAQPLILVTLGAPSAAAQKVINAAENALN